MSVTSRITLSYGCRLADAIETVNSAVSLLIELTSRSSVPLFSMRSGRVLDCPSSTLPKPSAATSGRYSRLTVCRFVSQLGSTSIVLATSNEKMSFPAMPASRTAPTLKPDVAVPQSNPRFPTAPNSVPSPLSVAVRPGGSRRPVACSTTTAAPTGGPAPFSIWVVTAPAVS